MQIPILSSQQLTVYNLCAPKSHLGLLLLRALKLPYRLPHFPSFVLSSNSNFSLQCIILNLYD